jgi:pantetheine-phosphate adenylyltransferase
MSNRTAVYPGTFDPLTNGHVDIIQRALQLFDRVIVAVADNRNKKPWLAYEKRIELAQKSLSHLPNVVVEGFAGLLTDFIKARDLTVVIRGLRAVSDFEYEFSLAGMNRKLMPEIETVYLMPSDEYMFVSSSFVREVAQLGGDVARFVPAPVVSILS